MNPEVKKLKERTSQYLQEHPEFRLKYRPTKRRSMRTRHKLKPGTTCNYCGKLLSTYTATIDHIVPLSRGGTNDSGNLCWCCKACNAAKSNKLINEWEDKPCM